MQYEKNSMNIGLYSFFTTFFFLFFKNAFTIPFFGDDFSQLIYAKVITFSDIIHFFSLQRDHFFRPLSTELYYFFITQFSNPTLIGHIITFLFFLGGVYFLVQIIKSFRFSKTLIFLFFLLYLFHFSHVYQLYWLATFQEALMFFFLSASLNFFVQKKQIVSLFFFVLALFSKEQAILFPVFVLLIFIWQKKKIPSILYFFGLFSFIFFLIHIYVSKTSPQFVEYAVHLSPRLWMNNIMWYLLWSLGFPSNLPDYMRSVFSFPLPEFWTFFSNFSFRAYMIIQLVFLCLFCTISLFLFIRVKKAEKRIFLSIFLFCVLSFALFLLPVLPIVHKWMVRLTIPLIFVCFFQAYILSVLWCNYKKARLVVLMMLGLYLLWNYFGVRVHERISTYEYESKIVKRANIIFSDPKYQSCKVLYFGEPKNMQMTEWEGSKKLALTFAGQSFLSYYFPHKKMKAIYAYEKKQIPNKSCVLDSGEFVK